MLLLEWSPATTEFAAHSPYNLAPFPERVLDPRGASSATVLRELLGWRASLLDFLADIWDVFDEPWLSCEDCTAVEHYLQPPDHGQLCLWCLAPITPKSSDHTCPLLAHICAKWPESPFNPPG